MDFIERIFHIAPDGGSGILELDLLLVFLILPLVTVAISKIRVRKSRKSRKS